MVWSPDASEPGGHGAGGRHQADPHGVPHWGPHSSGSSKTRVRARSATSELASPILAIRCHLAVWANQSCRLTLDLRTGKVTRGLCSLWLWGGGNSHPAVPRQQFRDYPGDPPPGPDLPLCSFSALQFATSRPWSCLACSPSSCWSTRW